MTERTKCPCCGKPLFGIRFTKEAAYQLIDVLLQEPTSIQAWVMGMFDLMHNPEKGEPIEEE